MRYSELPQADQDNIKDEIDALKDINDAWEIKVYNKAKHRYFHARRVSRPGQYAAFDGGSEWRLYYGRISFKAVKDPIGNGFSYHACCGSTFSKVNGIDIPRSLPKKADVIKLIKQIGIFEL